MKTIPRTPARRPDAKPGLAILYPGDRGMRDRSDPRESRFAALFAAFDTSGIAAEPAVYHDDFSDEVRTRLLQLDAVLVWHNPIEDGRTRAKLDAVLREVADHGVFVSAHPDTILRLGTKDVLPVVRHLPFGSDAWHVGRLQDLRTEVAARLSQGPRVLKQHRGHSGIGVWRIEALRDGRFALQHAQRGAVPESVSFETVLQRLAPYFESGGHMIDQAWQPRLAEGMLRAYLVGDRVAGFGHQAIVALHPGLAAGTLPSIGPRLYSDPDDARFQELRERLESEWVQLLCESTGTPRGELPLLWDADFMFGERTGNTERYVLCEINVSSVSPFPESAVRPLVDAVAREIASAKS